MRSATFLAAVLLTGVALPLAASAPGFGSASGSGNWYWGTTPDRAHETIQQTGTVGVDGADTSLPASLAAAAVADALEFLGPRSIDYRATLTWSGGHLESWRVVTNRVAQQGSFQVLVVECVPGQPGRLTDTQTGSTILVGDCGQLYNEIPEIQTWVLQPYIEAEPPGFNDALRGSGAEVADEPVQLFVHGEGFFSGGLPP